MCHHFFYILLEHNSMAKLHKPTRLAWYGRQRLIRIYTRCMIDEYLLEQARTVVCVFIYVSAVHYTVAHCYPHSTCGSRTCIHLTVKVPTHFRGILLLLFGPTTEPTNEQPRNVRSVRRAVKHHNSPCCFAEELIS